MRVLIVSKALVVASYRRKLAELARLGLEVIAVVPPEWREGGGVQRLESGNPAGYRLVVTPIRFNGRFHLHYYPRLGDLIDEIRPDVLHMDEEPYNLATFLAVQAAARHRIPSLFFTWQNLLRRYPPPFRQMEARVYRVAAHAMAGTEEAAEVLRAKGYRGPLSVVPQFGVDPEVYSPGPRTARPFTVGFLNRLIPAKDPLLTVEAFAALPSSARLLVVGDGPLRDQVASAIGERDLMGRVELRGRVPSSEMPDLIRSLDVVVLPSRTTPGWKEQFGRVLIEAMACEVPVVGSLSGEIPRVVGDAGILIPEGDLSAFVDALRRLQQDGDLRAELGRRGRERVLASYTHARIAEMTAGVYRSII